MIMYYIYTYIYILCVCMSVGVGVCVCACLCHVVFEVQQPESLQCRVCEVCFDSVEDLLDHVSSHVVLPTPNAAA